MFLTTKGRYAVMAMMELATAESQQPISSKVLAQKIMVDPIYLEQLLAKLKKRGIICSVRGLKGGYMVNRKLQSISVLAIMQAAEESLKMTRCHHNKGCLTNSAMCKAHNLWASLEKHIDSFLSNITLDGLISSYQGKCPMLNRLPQKLAHVEEFEEGPEHRTGVYMDVHEDPSTGPTYKLPTGVEFPQKSNQPQQQETAVNS